MFKGVKSLISIEMKSTLNALILSMQSTFEDCINLEKIEVNGFSTNGLKSINKLFYNTKINDLNISWINTSNIEDMSYLFAFSPIININLSAINTIWSKICHICFMNANH